MPKPIRRQLLVTALACAGSALVPAAVRAQGPAPGGRPLVFGLITPRAAEQTRKNWTPFIDKMAAALKHPIELQLFAEPDGLVQAFRKSAVDLAWMGNAAALDVVESGIGAVFAQMVAKDGSLGYRSILVVKNGSPLKNLSDVLQQAKKLKFGDGDLKSSSGHLVPSYFAFQKNGVDDIRTLFKSVSNASHQKNLMMVARGEVDVATANNEELAFFAHDYADLAKTLQVIWESPLIPQSPLVWRTALPADTRRKVLQFTVSFGGTEEERRLLSTLNNLSGFRQSNNRQLVSAADLEMFKARQMINNDPALSPQDRAKRIDEVIRRGSKLDLMLKLSASGR